MKLRTHFAEKETHYCVLGLQEALKKGLGNVSPQICVPTVLSSFKGLNQSRISFSESQIDELERMFCVSQYPDIFLREVVADRLGISEARIQVGAKASNFFGKNLEIKKCL